MALEFRENNKALINTKYKPPQQIQDDRKKVYLRHAYMKSGRSVNGQNLEPLWDKWEKQYESWRPNKSADDWQSNIVPPFTTTIVERSLGEIIDQTLQPMIVPRGIEDTVRAKVLNYVKDYTWEIGDGDLELYASIKQALVLGKTIWHETYWQDKRKVKLLKKFDFEKNEEEYIEKEIYDFDDVYGENVDIRNFFIDPQARSINRGRYKAQDVINRYIMNYDAFMENFSGTIYDQFGVSKLVQPGGDLNYYQYYKPPEGIDKDNQVEVLFYWGRRPDKLIIVANDVVIRDGPNPYNHKQLPFAEGSDVPRLNQFWASGEPKLLESIQDELTTLRRMRIDRQHMDIWKMFLVSNRENLDDDEAIIAPSRFLYVDDPANSIRALEYSPVHPTAYQEEDRLKQDGREVTGIESPQPSGTATEAAIFKESTMKALRLKIWLLSRELLTGIIRLRVPNIVQYYTVPKTQKVIGEKKFAEYRNVRTTDVELETTKQGELLENEKKGFYFFTVTPDLIVPQYGGYDYKLSGEPTFPISKPLQQQKVAEFMQHPVIQGAIASGIYDIGKMADELAKINDYEPEKFKAQQRVDEEAQAPKEEALYELANRENEQMLEGVDIPPTGFATRGHTDIHLAFMSSPNFKLKFNHKLSEIFTKHILEEAKAQEIRSGAAQEAGMGMMPQVQSQGSVAQGVAGSAAQQAMPGRMVGQSEMTEGIAG